MAIAKDHVTVTTGATSGSAISVTASTGNLSVVFASLAGQTVTGVVDSKGNTYVSAGIPARPTGTRWGEVWYAANAATGITSVTVSWAGGGSNAFAIYDCSGADATNPLSAYSQTAFAQPASANPVGPTVQVPTGGGIVIAGIAANVSAIGAPFTLDGSSTQEGFGSDVNASSGTFTPSWTTTSATWAGITVAFKSTAGVPLLVRTVTFGATPVTIPSTAAGNLLVVGVFSDGVITGITDNGSGGSNTYTQCSNSPSSSGVGALSVYYATNIHAAATIVTLAHSSGTSWVATVYEISGADTAAPFDVANHANSQTAGTSGPPFKMVNPSLTTTYAQEIIVAIIANNAALISPFVDGPFIYGADQNAGVASRIVISSGSYNASYDSNTSADPYNVSIASFVVAGGGAPPLGPPQLIFGQTQPVIEKWQVEHY